jgi:hypothetical protein
VWCVERQKKKATQHKGRGREESCTTALEVSRLLGSFGLWTASVVGERRSCAVERGTREVVGCLALKPPKQKKGRFPESPPNRPTQNLHSLGIRPLRGMKEVELGVNRKFSVSQERSKEKSEKSAKKNPQKGGKKCGEKEGRMKN